MFRRNLVTAIIFSSMTLSGLLASVTAKAKIACVDLVESVDPQYDLFNVTFKDGEFDTAGLSERGMKIFAKQHEVINSSEKIIGSRLFSIESFTDTTRILQVGRWNGMVLGPPSGGKSSMFMLMMPDLWVRQVHQMMNEVPLIG